MNAWRLYQRSVEKEMTTCFDVDLEKKFKKHSEKVFFSGVVMNQFYPEDNGMGIRIPKDKSLQVS